MVTEPELLECDRIISIHGCEFQTLVCKSCYAPGVDVCKCCVARYGIKKTNSVEEFDKTGLRVFESQSDILLPSYRSVKIEQFNRKKRKMRRKSSRDKEKNNHTYEGDIEHLIVKQHIRTGEDKIQHTSASTGTEKDVQYLKSITFEDNVKFIEDSNEGVLSDGNTDAISSNTDSMESTRPVKNKEQIYEANLEQPANPNKTYEETNPDQDPPPNTWKLSQSEYKVPKICYRTVWYLENTKEFAKYTFCECDLCMAAKMKSESLGWKNCFNCWKQKKTVYSQYRNVPAPEFSDTRENENLKHRIQVFKKKMALASKHIPKKGKKRNKST